ncbi:CHRD domain-containing protein [Marinobacterium sedimentorum]|uniref:CHRD domain-containing protein n=1 Tax=Marinobacterium sedimentorum TaxID=2927804 RepID=UPI0020C63D4E|nr:CHRD domain-containing protein [Marinobacterium sedimentorum]MCP8686755.1 CHRD domain-containing protein [Marinobacterium sedimentorum]
MKLQNNYVAAAVRTSLFGLLIAGAPLALAGHTNTLLTATLSGDEEIGAMGASDGKGHALVFGVDGDDMTLCYALQVSGIEMVPVGSGMAAHIHHGKKGSNGPVVAALAGPEDGDAADCVSEYEKGKFPTHEAGMVKRILANPSDYYINVHNPSHPGGAIRGQLQHVGM